MEDKLSNRLKLTDKDISYDKPRKVYRGPCRLCGVPTESKRNNGKFTCWECREVIWERYRKTVKSKKEQSP